MGQHVGQGSQKQSTLLLPVGMWALTALQCPFIEILPN